MISADFSLDPYPGLRPFRQEETDIFFGREEHTDQLLERLANHRFLAVTGLSGCGKSSLVRAGLIPALNRGFVAKAGHRWRVAQMRPGRTPFARLAGGLLNAAAIASEREGIAGGVEFVEKTLRRGPMGLAEVLRQTPPPAGTNLLLVVDQFEEIFRFRTEDEVGEALTSEQSQQQRQRRIDEAEAFVQLLLASKDQVEFPVFVLLTMRTDYLGHCAVFRGLLEVINESQYIPPPLSREQLIEAISAPAQVFNGRVEETLCHRLLNDASSSQDQLPLLQHALMRMWTLAKQGQGEKSSQNPIILTVEDYARIGSIRPSADGGSALSRQGRELLDNLGSEKRHIAEMLFRALSGGATDRRDTRRFVSVRKVAAIAQVTPKEVIEVADIFRAPGCDFITAIAGEGFSGKLQPETELDISHESLIRHWDRLKGWVDREARAGTEYRRLVGEEERYSAGHRAELTALELQNALAWQRDLSPNDVWAQRYGGSYQKVKTFLTKSAQAAKRERLKSLLIPVAIIAVLALVGSYCIEWRKQQSNWTEEFKEVDFSKAPLDDQAQAQWLKDKFVFEKRDATLPEVPWPVRDGAMVMRTQEWCWLNIRIRGDTKAVVDLQFDDKPEAFQICINAKKTLRDWNNNPPGYSCRFGIWNGSMDLITRGQDDRPNDFNSFLVSSTPQDFSLPNHEEHAPAGMGAAVGNAVVHPGGYNVLSGDDTAFPAGARPRDFSLTFMREGDKVSLQVNGEEVHHGTYMVPLLAEHDAQGFERIGIRTWGANVKVRKISAYRKKLAEKASPIVAADALVEVGDLDEAIEKYKTIANDYKEVSSSIFTDALIRGYQVAIEHKHAEDFEKDFQNSLNKRYQDKVLEVETLKLWQEGRYPEALHNFHRIFEANHETHIAVECLQAEHKPLKPEVSKELLQWVAATTPKLAGLNISSFDMADLRALGDLPWLRGLYCPDNLLTDLYPLRSIDQLRALYCGHNQIATLEPIKALKRLIDLACDENCIESLEPLSDMRLLSKLNCGGNRIEDLSPLQGKPIYALDCSHNQISSLDPISDLPELLELYCGSNQISSIEPLRQAKKLQYLDCSFNAIQTLEALKDLALESLRCSGNRISSLEPFVDAKDPPQTFIFDCDTLPDAEIERAIAAWSKKGRNVNVEYGQDLLAKRALKGRKSSRLGMQPGIPATEDVLKVVVKDFGPRL
jgi:Leucine-rich repeat (LRR) protein